MRKEPEPLSGQTEISAVDLSATVDSVTATQPAEQFDLSKYRTPELFDEIAIAAISSIDAILKLVLRLTDQVVLDHAQMQSGEMQILSGPELSRRIFEDIVWIVLWSRRD